MTFKSFSDYLSLEKNYSSHTINAYVKDLESFSSFCENEFNEKNIDNVNYAQIRIFPIEASIEKFHHSIVILNFFLKLKLLK